MKQRIHICQSVSGALANWSRKDWEMVARDNDCSIDRIKGRFRIMELEGKKVIPIGDACEGFSYETGCPSHPVEET